MGIEFEDGTSVNTENWFRMMSLIQQRAKEGKPNPVSITKDGVKIKVKGHSLVPNTKLVAESSNYIESTHRDWKIRVWRMEEECVYGCNYYKGEDIRYLEVPFGDVRDENGVFRYASSIINEIED
jgi:hypothetical protein